MYLLIELVILILILVLILLLMHPLSLVIGIHLLGHITENLWEILKLLLEVIHKGLLIKTRLIAWISSIVLIIDVDIVIHRILLEVNIRVWWLCLLFCLLLLILIRVISLIASELFLISYHVG